MMAPRPVMAYLSAHRASLRELIENVDCRGVESALRHLVADGYAERHGREYALTPAGKRRLRHVEDVRSRIVSLPWSSCGWDSHHVWWLIRADDRDHWLVYCVLEDLAADGHLSVTVDGNKRYYSIGRAEDERRRGGSMTVIHITDYEIVADDGGRGLCYGYCSLPDARAVIAIHGGQVHVTLTAYSDNVRMEWVGDGLDINGDTVGGFVDARVLLQDRAYLYHVPPELRDRIVSASELEQWLTERPADEGVLDCDAWEADE